MKNIVYDAAKSLLPGTLILFFLIALFLIARTKAQGPGSDILAKQLPATTARTQIQVWAGWTRTVWGTLNNDTTNQCGAFGNNYVVRDFSQNTTSSFNDVTYWYFNTWGSAITSTGTGTASQLLTLPPSYNLTCWPNEPQVQWQNS